MPSIRYSVTQNASGVTVPYFPDTMVRPFNIGVGAVVSSSGVLFSVEHSFDYTGSSAFVSSAATWFPNSGITARSCNTDGNYAFPVSAIRLNVSSAAGSSVTVTLTLIQAG
jgi:hypothetical protein